MTNAFARQGTRRTAGQERLRTLAGEWLWPQPRLNDRPFFSRSKPRSQLGRHNRARRVGRGQGLMQHMHQGATWAFFHGSECNSSHSQRQGPHWSGHCGSSHHAAGAVRVEGNPRRRGCVLPPNHRGGGNDGACCPTSPRAASILPPCAVGPRRPTAAPGRGRGSRDEGKRGAAVPRASPPSNRDGGNGAR